jgi:hypothetical protein
VPGNETWSGDSWKTGGAAIWNTGTYDPDLNLTYWGTGNPSPDFDGAKFRLGDNLCSDSVVALDADTGALRWVLPVHPPRGSRLGFSAGAHPRGRSMARPTKKSHVIRES